MPEVLGLVMPSNTIRALAFAPIEPKSVQVVCRVLALGVVQLATCVLPANTRPPLKLPKVVPFGNVAVIVLVPAFESPPVADVVKVATYCVVADWAELPGATVRPVSALAPVTV